MSNVILTCSVGGNCIQIAPNASLDVQHTCIYSNMGDQCIAMGKASTLDLYDVLVFNCGVKRGDQISDYVGGAITSDQGTIRISSSVFRNNSAGYHKADLNLMTGAITATYSSSLVIHNTTFVLNDCLRAGAISIVGKSSADISESSLEYNRGKVWGIPTQSSLTMLQLREEVFLFMTVHLYI